MVSRLASVFAGWLIVSVTVVCAADDALDRVGYWGAQIRHPAAAFRQRAIDELGRMGTQSVSILPALLDRLGDVDAKVRLSAVQAIALIQSDGVLSETELVSTQKLVPLLSDADEHVRYAAEWALARFAIREIDAGEEKRFADEFEKAVRTLESRPHNERHFRVLKTTSERLRQQVAQSEVPTPSKIQVTNSNPTESFLQGYEASDTVRQLVIIHQLTPVEGELAEQAVRRRSVLRSALISSSQLQVHFALKRWKSEGQQAVRAIFDSLPANGKLPDWTSSVLFELIPRNEVDLQTLQGIANRQGNPNIVRTAAVSSLGRSGVRVESRCKALLDLLPLEDQTIRAETVLQLAALCVPDFYQRFGEETQERLVSQLRAIASDSENYYSTQLEAVIGLAKLQHPLALHFVDSYLRDGKLRGYQYPRLVDAVVAFGRPTVIGERVLLQSLHTNDEFAQEAALKAISKLKFPAGNLLPAILELIGNNPSGTEKHALAALASYGPEELQRSLQWLTQPCEGRQSEDRALAIITALSDLGQQATVATGAFAELIVDKSLPTHLRLAAAFGLGYVATPAELDAERLKQVMHFDGAAEMRAAVLLSLARLGVLEMTEVEQVPFQDNSKIGQVALAVARHAIDPSEGTDDLIAMLGEQGSDLAEQALVDFGPEVARSLERIVKDSTAHSTQRIKAMGVLTRIPAKDYKPLISTLADKSIAEPCQDCLYGLLDSSDSVLEDMVSVIQDLPESEARDRVASLIETYAQGVGSGGEDGEQFAALGKLSETMMYQALDQRRSEDLDRIASAKPTPTLQPGGRAVASVSPAPVVSTPRKPASSALRLDQPAAKMGHFSKSGSGGGAKASQAAEVSFADELDITLFVADDTPESVSSTVAIDLPYPEDPVGLASLELPAAEPPETLIEEASDAASIGLSMFSEEENLTSPEFNSLLDAEKGLLPRDRSKVKVFYGTNREVSTGTEASGMAVRWFGSTKQKAVAMLVSVAVIAVCLFGFLRQRALLYSVFAVAGLCLVIGLGLGNIGAKSGYESEIPKLSYGGRFSSELQMGMCEVSLPENHVEGELESKNLFRFEVTNDPEKHVVLKKTVRLAEDDFFDELRQETDLRGDSLLVFIHGYNVSFVDAARRTAQLAYDLEYEGAPVFYSWPSNANWYQYQLDKKNVQLSVGLIKEFLVKLSEDSGVDTINVIAHSMGNVGLTSALAEMDLGDKPAPFNQVVLAAPDLDADIFEARIAPKIVDKARRFTLYTSSGDLALIASRYFNAGRRLGESGDPMASYPGIDVIDASGVDTSLLGHSYYGSSISVIQDLGDLLKDHPVHYRDNLKTASSMGRNYWVLETPIVALRTEGVPGFQLR